MKGFTDIHTHFVYGLDDCAIDYSQMCEMLDAAVADGVTTLYATPHVTPGVVPFDADLFQERLTEAQAYCEKKEYDVHILPGAEILYNKMIERSIAEHLLPCLGDGNTVLVEFSPDVSYKELCEALRQIIGGGYEVILAHTERYLCLYGRHAYRLKNELPVSYQINANSVVRGSDSKKHRIVQKWLKDGLVDYIASDAHNTDARSTKLQKAYEAVSSLLDKEAAARMMCFTLDGAPGDDFSPDELITLEDEVKKTKKAKSKKAACCF